jgi:hypothetical protein
MIFQRIRIFMRLFSRRMMAMLVVVSTITPIVCSEQMMALAGKALVPFCAGVYRGAEDYKKGEKVQASVVGKESLVVGSVTASAGVLQSVMLKKELDKFNHASTQKAEDNRYYINVQEGTYAVSNFMTEKGAEGLIQGVKDAAKYVGDNMLLKSAQFFGVQICAFPAGYAVGYHVMKFWDRKHKKPVVAEEVTEQVVTKK